MEERAKQTPGPRSFAAACFGPNIWGGGGYATPRCGGNASDQRARSGRRPRYIPSVPLGTQVAFPVVQLLPFGVVCR